MRSQSRRTIRLGQFGDIDVEALLGLGFDTITIQTNVQSKPIVIDLHAPSTGGTSALIADLQPVITFAGRIGTFKIAPGGDPNVSGQQRSTSALVEGGLGVLAALIGILALGRALS